MRTSEFDFDLPEDQIAQHPLPRGTSRLLVVEPSGRNSGKKITDLPDLLDAGDLLVLNNTKVLPARLSAWREQTGGRLEILLLQKHSDTEWEVMVRPARRAKPGKHFILSDQISVEILTKSDEGRVTVEFSEPIAPHLDHIGHVPLPPYIRRADADSDRIDYQTVFASRPGAIAAPTAGLHFTDQLLSRIRAAGIRTAELTLHVGAGTFKPVKVDQIDFHKMESERFDLPAATVTAIEQTQDQGGRVIAVGTTVVRALESAALDLGGKLEANRGSTELFITPGFEFSVVDRLLTNFHLPRSTLLMLACAFAGKNRVLTAYEKAVEQEYRFYSYGDAMLLTRTGDK
jgi:S-adenosylmethionine:tRNA ribosyltransferase-isomerase